MASAPELVKKGLALPGGNGGGASGDSGGDGGSDNGYAEDGDVTDCPLFKFLVQFNDGELPKVVRTNDYKLHSSLTQSQQHAAAGGDDAGGEPMDSEQYDSDGVAFSF